jgi:acyl-CoA thioesterase-1
VAAQSIDGAAIAVTFSPAAIGGTAPVTVGCNPASGTSFAPGTSTVTCTAADAAGHTKTCAFAVNVTVPPRLTATSFLAFGDSMTAGEVTKPLTMKLTVVESSSYPTRLKALLTARYTAQAITMTNAGKPAERTSGGLTRLPGLLAQEAPAVVLLMEGVNDLCNAVPVSTIEANLRQMISDSRGAGSVVFLGTLPPQREGGYRARCFSKVPTCNTMIASLARETNVPLVDIYGAFGGVAGTLIGEDGLHPNEAGYLKIAETFFEAIKSNLEAPDAVTIRASAASSGLLAPRSSSRANDAPRGRDRQTGR